MLGDIFLQSHGGCHLDDDFVMGRAAWNKSKTYYKIIKIHNTTRNIKNRKQLNVKLNQLKYYTLAINITN